jgi:hypothetical protein
MTRTTKDDSSKLQGDLNFAFDQQESEGWRKWSQPTQDEFFTLVALECEPWQVNLSQHLKIFSIRWLKIYWTETTT